MKRIYFMTIIMMALCAGQEAGAQSVLKGLGKKALERVKDKTEQKVLDKVDKTTDDLLEGKLPGKKKGAEADSKEEKTQSQAGQAEAEAAAPEKKKAEGEEVKSDFVPGSVVIFEDNLQGEQMGEFPSKWDLIENNAEVAKMNGRPAIKFEHGSDTEITPLLEDNNKKYLPEVYTLEFDFFVTAEEEKTSAYRLWLKTEADDATSEIFFSKDQIGWRVLKPTDDQVDGNASTESLIKGNDWNHFALSFNKRALKVYVNDKRFINIPNARAMDWFSLRTEFWEDHIDYITNVRLAKGAVELYDRNAQTMTAVEKAIAETGKFVTNNILFETGKATLKPESMEEIQKVADYMKKNTSARFEVQGHTDNQGSDKVNDPLSQQRAEAVVKALAELGVDEFNLKPVGKGSKEPIADNSTDEGRAKNRRVVFVKK